MEGGALKRREVEEVVEEEEVEEEEGVEEVENVVVDDSRAAAI